MDRLKRYEFVHTPVCDDLESWAKSMDRYAGAYCLSSDVAALEAENAELEDALEAILLLCNKYRAGQAV